MKLAAIVLSATLGLSGCSSIVNIPDPEPPVLVKNENTEFLTMAPPATGKVVAAVYGFTDKTGQRKPSDTVSNLSSAVTQGSEAWVIKALQEVGNGEWFEVVERVGMDNLIKERQLIRQTRENYQGKDAVPLEPLRFAGLILEGGIVGYDSNIAVGGIGASWLGIGASTEYRIDNVTVVMRIVSVSTGKVLLSIATEKTIASHRSGADIFKFLDMGTKLLETETGFSVNEPVNYAVRAAVEQGIVELVHEGERKGLWKFQEGKQNEIENIDIIGVDDNVPSSSSG